MTCPHAERIRSWFVRRVHAAQRFHQHVDPEADTVFVADHLMECASCRTDALGYFDQMIRDLPREVH